jgi:hypothetical protein
MQLREALNAPRQIPGGHRPDELMGTLMPGRNLVRPLPGSGDRNIEQLLYSMMAKRAATKSKRSSHIATNGKKKTFRMAVKHVKLTNRLMRAFARTGVTQVQPGNEIGTLTSTRSQLLIAPGSMNKLSGRSAYFQPT